jgi:hypothetical protein
MSLLDDLTYKPDQAYPTPTPYNPANYQGVPSALYNALQGQAQGQTSQAAQNLNRLPGGGSVSAGAANGTAAINAAGQMQPFNVQMGMNQWNLGNQLAQRNWQTQDQINQANQAGLGSMLGMGAGALAAWNKQNDANNALAAPMKSSPVNNPIYSVGNPGSYQYFPGS